MELECIILSKISQSDKETQIPYDFTHMEAKQMNVREGKKGNQIIRES